MNYKINKIKIVNGKVKIVDKIIIPGVIDFTLDNKIQKIRDLEIDSINLYNRRDHGKFIN